LTDSVIFLISLQIIQDCPYGF